MLYIICAEEEESKNLKCPDAEVIITGVGLFNVLKSPRINISEGDIVLNIGYAGSNLYEIGEVFSVSSCQRLKPSNTVKEEKQYLYPYYFSGADCYTADDFIENGEFELPLVDMELYYLSLIYPNIRAIKIVSDNLNYCDYKKQNFDISWQLVNKAIKELVNGKN